MFIPCHKGFTEDRGTRRPSGYVVKNRKDGSVHMDSREPMERRLLRIPEAATALGIGRTTLYEMVRRGEIPIVRIGRAVRIPATAIDVWVADRTRQADTE